MKRSNIIISTTIGALLGLTLFAGCGPNADVDARVAGGASLSTTPGDGVCATDEYDLLAGQSIDAGAVRIDNDGENLLIALVAEDGWEITEVHIFAGTGGPPVNRKGTVVPGQFPYNTTYATAVTEHTQVIPLADLGVGCGDTLNTVVHAVVRRPDGAGYQEETAFGDGTPLTTTRWGFSSTRELCCEPPDDDPEQDCVETIEFWAADPSSWPNDGAALAICWSPETGSITLATAVNTTGSSPVFDALVDEIAAAKNNQAVFCADFDCIIYPAFFEGIQIVNDCVIDDGESARAEAIIALLHTFNDGTYDYGQCWGG